MMCQWRERSQAQLHVQKYASLILDAKYAVFPLVLASFFCHLIRRGTIIVLNFIVIFFAPDTFGIKSVIIYSPLFLE